jgi:hypothetical protein
MARIHETEIARICTGTTNKMGTEWPIESYMSRIQEEGKTRPYWLVTYNLCSGVPTGSMRFATKAEALAELDEIAQPLPRRA